jgi:hypothetical protein
MYKLLFADKDTYITDRVVRNTRMTTSNVGAAGSLDLFKLYGYSFTSGTLPNIELSRLLVHFDLDPIRDLITAGRLNTNDPSFACHLKLFDVYGGQPTPRNFRVNVYPLSRSFDEGLGRDIVLYGDTDTCNFLSSSFSDGAWVSSGANAGGLSTSNVDYITFLNSQNLVATQLFETGLEDLYIDVTTIISSTLAEMIPDEGFRISLDRSLETNTRTYFVKRFAARTANNQDKRPRLIVRFDDSVLDDTSNVVFDADNDLFLYNYSRGTATNLVSSSITLRMLTEVSGGYLEFTFSGSQYVQGGNLVTGFYSASVNIPSTNPLIASKIAQSGSVKFIPIWGSNDGTIAFLTGSAIYVNPASRGSNIIEPKKYVVSVTGLKSEFDTSESTILRVNIFDQSSPMIKLVKTPVTLPGVVIRDVYYSLRDAASNVVIVPFDKTNKSTRVSSDGEGMYFPLDTSNLTPGRQYIVDILISTNNNDQIYRDASPAFRVVDSAS